MRIIICAAGTGGHINPAIAIANKIKEKEPNSKIVFIGTNRGLENDLVPRAGYELKTIEAYGLKKEISIRNIIHIIKTIKSSKDVKKIIDEFKPDLVLGTGGYICGPVISSAISRKIPTVLHESNAYPGRAVKMFAKDVNLLLTGFQETKNRLKDCKKIVVTGTPTKIKKVRIDENRKKEILKEFGIKNDLPIVLIFGGSQGAKAINDAVFNLIIKKLNKDYQIIWVAGTKQYDIIKESFEKENIYINHLTNVKVLPYIYNMEEIMNISDLLVARSGAMTITEVSIVGKPAIFIPLPSKSANRQEDNARVLEKIGAAKIILNKDLNEEKLSLEINDIIFNKSELEEMGNLANRFAPSNVEEKIYLEIKKMLEELKNNNDR
ncbi:MAG: undecaprenyldiphospho-muramoylpentapeptide beta-N-acetylglucosaminyltransferase [Clostridia bacterium]|nr:undecaprenyldiphospho-muramoylpentapeptide beta-N-acetylglucosaminyltransferase [Clostridia bacterium]